jgi:hypothetical protein
MPVICFVNDTSSSLFPARFKPPTDRGKRWVIVAAPPLLRHCVISLHGNNLRHVARIIGTRVVRAQRIVATHLATIPIASPHPRRFLFSNVASARCRFCQRRERDQSPAYGPRISRKTQPPTDRGKQWEIVADPPLLRHRVTSLRDNDLRGDACIIGTRVG